MPAAFCTSDTSQTDKLGKLECLVESLSAANDRLQKTVEELEKRVSILEFAPGGSEFKKILDEAKEAGDFSC